MIGYPFCRWFVVVGLTPNFPSSDWPLHWPPCPAIGLLTRGLARHWLPACRRLTQAPDWSGLPRPA